MANDNLGPLAGLIGEWKGHGFSQIQLPDSNQTPASKARVDAVQEVQNRLPPGAAARPVFRFKFNATTETLKFEELDGPIPYQCGASATDISFAGLRYLQQIDDIGTEGDLHHEPGFLLYTKQEDLESEKPNLLGITPTYPKDMIDPRIYDAQLKELKPTTGRIVRQGLIPHGNSFVLQGSVDTFSGAPIIPELSTQPFGTILGNPTGISLGALDEHNKAALKAASNTFPPGMTEAELLHAMLFPNAVLRHDIDRIKAQGDEVVKTTRLIMADPSILNIQYLRANASSAKFLAVFWLQTIKEKSTGKDYLLLQYSQFVHLRFQVFDWPHFTVATLRKTVTNPN